ncbi:MAG: A/G-specific adenine glycosylase [Chloroflexi bacterium]|nr:A/G-specific adenine glycosylase [Chloroflexota bacterium]
MSYWSCPRLPDELRDSLLPGDPEDILRIRQALVQWYAQNHRRLPWRETHDPYRIWVSEVMLQQTQVNTVIPYYHRFLDRFPTLQSLARADLQDVLKVWEGLGYYARARNLHRAAKEIAEEHDGQIPDAFTDFRKLPGVGEYIAAAVMSIAFDRPHAVIDGNVKRVFARLFRIETPVNSSNAQKAFRDIAGELLDSTDPGTFNQALMELGAMVCTPSNPRCGACPLMPFCRAHQTGSVSEYPGRAPSRTIPTQHIAVGAIRKGKRVLITRRKPEGLLGGLWEFPGGKVREGESAEQACVREIKEETGIDVEIIGRLTRVKHAYTHIKIVMDVFECRYLSGKVRLNGPVDSRWATIEELERFPFPKANNKFIPLLRRM